VLVTRLAIHNGLEKWDLLAIVAKKLAEWNPKEGLFRRACLCDLPSIRQAA
jgi:hypothetical protein